MIRRCFLVELKGFKHFSAHINWDENGVFITIERHFDEESWILLSENTNFHFENRHFTFDGE